MRIPEVGLLLLTVLLFVTCKPDKKEEPIPTSLPVVNTGEVTNITSTAASAEGQVTSDGNLAVTARGFVLSTTIDPTTSDTKVSVGDGVGVFTGNITNLNRVTTYYIRTYATNSKGTTYGLHKIFTTIAQLPTVTTTEISGIAASAASGGGNITDDGGSPITERGVCWSTNQNPTIDDNKTTDAVGSGSFSSGLTNLVCSTTYYVRAYATSSAGTAYGTQIQFTTLAYTNPNLNPNLTYGSVSDIDGNTYATIAIGTQTWMAENLKVSHYNNGDVIDNVTESAAWAALTTGAYAYYNNDAVNNEIYGKLYNWYAIAEARGICPSGWHMPSNAEWTTLVNYLGGSAVAGGKMKAVGYPTDPNTGGATNESGFTGLAGGNRSNDGSFQYSGSYLGSWWSATELDTVNAWYAFLTYYNSGLSLGNFGKAWGLSVRCVKD